MPEMPEIERLARNIASLEDELTSKRTLLKHLTSNSYVADVLIYTDGMTIAHDAKGDEVDVCTGFILAVGAKLLEHCDENTKFSFIKHNVWKEEGDFTRMLREAKDKAALHAIFDHYGITKEEIKREYQETRARAGE